MDISTILAADTNLFLFLNGLHHPLTDIIFKYITNKFTWIPLYIFLIILVWVKQKKKSIYTIIGITLVIFITDQVSVHFFKNVFERLRPCHNFEIQNLVHIINGHCGGRFGFVSSHAANSFALAIFIGKVLTPWYKKIMLWLVFWAILVSYSRIYVGVHYPLDVLGGGMLGIFVAYCIWYILKQIDIKYK